MKLFNWMNERAKRFTAWDIKLAQGAAQCLILIIVKLIPQILTISIWWFVGLLIIFAVRPLYLTFLSK
jgi:hypothetical protein